MLPLECYYVAEIRYEEYVRAARQPRRDAARSAAWLPRPAFGRPALVALRQAGSSWLADRSDYQPQAIHFSRDLTRRANLVSDLS